MPTVPQANRPWYSLGERVYESAVDCTFLETGVRRGDLWAMVFEPAGSSMAGGKRFNVVDGDVDPVGSLRATRGCVKRI